MENHSRTYLKTVIDYSFLGTWNCFLHSEEHQICSDFDFGCTLGFVGIDFDLSFEFGCEEIGFGFGVGCNSDFDLAIDLTVSHPVQLGARTCTYLHPGQQLGLGRQGLGKRLPPNLQLPERQNLHTTILVV